MNVSFHFLKKTSLKERIKLKKFIEKIFELEGMEFFFINVIFCDDLYLLKLNNDFLSHNYFTDILSFNLAPPLKPVEGEIYISTDRLSENSKFFNISFNHELHRVIFHGILHFCGYSDKSKTDKLLMTRKEDFYLKLYFVPRET